MAINTAEEFYNWTFKQRGEKCKCVSNEPVGMKKDDVKAKATFWSEKPMSFPQSVSIKHSTRASGEAPAVEKEEVEGWHKYEITFEQ